MIGSCCFSSSGLLLLWRLLTHCRSVELQHPGLWIDSQPERGVQSLRSAADVAVPANDRELQGLLPPCLSTVPSHLWVLGGGHEPRVHAAVCFWLCRGSGGHQLRCAGLFVCSAAGSLLRLYRKLTCPAFVALPTQTKQVRAANWLLQCLHMSHHRTVVYFPHPLTATL